jgi:hypothetical protein
MTVPVKPRATLRNSQALVCAVYPMARVEGHTTNDRKRYYLIRTKYGEQDHCGNGNTKAQAWKAAAINLGLGHDDGEA